MNIFNVSVLVWDVTGKISSNMWDLIMHENYFYRSEVSNVYRSRDYYHQVMSLLCIILMKWVAVNKVQIYYVVQHPVVNHMSMLQARAFQENGVHSDKTVLSPVDRVFMHVWYIKKLQPSSSLPSFPLSHTLCCAITPMSFVGKWPIRVDDWPHSLQKMVS